jgi:hypothetical protein
MKTKLIAFINNTGSLEAGYLYTFLTTQTALLIAGEMAIIVCTSRPLLNILDLPDVVVTETTRFDFGLLHGDNAMRFPRHCTDPEFYQQHDDSNHRFMGWQRTALTWLRDLPHPSYFILNSQIPPEKMKYTERNELNYQICRKLNNQLSMARLMVSSAISAYNGLEMQQLTNLCIRFHISQENLKQVYDKPVVLVLPDTSEVIATRVDSDSTMTVELQLHHF